MPALSGSQRALMQARYGMARYGATRFGYYIPNQVVVIAGVNLSSKVEKGTVGVTLNNNDVADEASFTLNPNPGFTPLDDQQVIIGLGTAANAEFSGFIRSVTHRVRPGNQSPYFDIQCTDETRLLDAVLVTGDWVGWTADAIVIDILTRFTTGFTHRGIQPNLPVISNFSATNERVSSTIRRIATQINGGCYWRQSDVHLYPAGGETGSRAPTPPRTITDTLATLASPPLAPAHFSHSVDGDQKRNRVIVDAKRTTCPVSTPDGVTSAVVSATANVDYLVVAGGGAGGANPSSGGGGGAGGVLQGTFVMPGGTGAAITVGAGGATVGANGSDSAFGGFVATGGGGGGGSVAPGHTAGSAGGSGGGGTEVSAAGGAGTAGQGNAGGAGVAIGGGNAAGGGGGASAGGGAGGATGIGGTGGAGVSSSITGAPMYYGGGGGGNGNVSSGGGGIGGGGNGGAGGNPSSAGAANTGGGGGGSSDNNNARQAGGSGIVIVRYLTGLMSATGGTITTSGGYTIHTFTSNGTFTLSTITITAPVPSVTILPLEDASQIDPGAGTVRIGNFVTPYVNTLGPAVASGSNLPGSTLTADAAAGATSLSVADISQFTDTHGWAKVGDQYVYWDSKGASSLTGIPALGFGSLVAAVKSGASVTWLGSIAFASGIVFSPSLIAGAPVVQRVIVDDLTAQAVLAARRGGTGVIEDIIDADTEDVAGATQLAAAALASFAGSNLKVNWSTWDLNARPNVKQAINRSIPESLVATVDITRVDISFPAPSHLPLRTCQGSIVSQPSVVDIIVVNQRQ